MTYKLIRVNFYLPLKLRKKYTISVVVSRLSLSQSICFKLQVPHFVVTAVRHVNHPRGIREQHLIKELCGRSGIMGYVTFHHKTRRAPLMVALYMRNSRCYLSHNRGASWGAVGEPQR